eukprot:5400994-Pyramimonas_sp.AAC.1
MSGPPGRRRWPRTTAASWALGTGARAFGSSSVWAYTGRRARGGSTRMLVVTRGDWARPSFSCRP